MGGIWSKVKITYAVMWIGTLALIGFPGLRRLLQQGRDPGGGLGLAQRRSTLRVLAAAMLAAVLTAFYSGRLIWLTFHGEPRADHETMHHVHESPPVMTVPLIVLAAGAVLARLARAWAWSTPRATFWAGAICPWRAQPRPARDARGAVLGEAGAVPGDGRSGSGFSWLCYIRGPACGAQIAAMAGPINRSSTTSGTSTSSTTSCSSDPPRRWATASGAAATSASSTGSAPTASRHHAGPSPGA